VGHTGDVQKESLPITERMWQIVPIFLVVAMQAWRGYVSKGLSGVSVIFLLLLSLGWVAGWVMAELDHVFYAMMNNPQELSSQRVRAELARKNWRGAWSLLTDTKGERSQLPMRNVLTLLVVEILGLWTVTAAVNPFAAGLVYGLGVKLVSELLMTTNYKSWYWVFAREFGDTEHKLVLLVSLGLMLWQTLLLWR
jgi:hypothetical protein